MFHAKRHSSSRSSPGGPSFTAEALEGRRLLSSVAAAAVLDHHGNLDVNGTRRSDHIVVAMDRRHARVLDVSVDGHAFAFRAAGVKHILVAGGRGNDAITVGDSVTAPATLAGGEGDDTIVAGGGNDQVDGGTGNDDCEFGHHSGVPLAQVPQPVQDGLNALAQGATITNVQVFHDDGQTYYGAVVSVNGVDTRIVVDSTGAPVSSDPQGDHQGDGGGDHGGDQGEHHGFGLVVGVDAAGGTITVGLNSEHGAAQQVTFNVDPAATVTVDGAAATLADVPAGAVVSLHFSAPDPTTGARTVTAIDAFGRRAEGTLSAVDANGMTVTVTGEHGGADQTLTVAANATITRDGTPATLADLAAGDEVRLQFSADGSTVLAIHAEAGDGQGQAD